MKWQVPYKVTVVAVVDTDTQNVDRVVAIDETIAPADEPVMNLACDEIASEDEARRAVEIAETKDWPAWRSDW